MKDVDIITIGSGNVFADLHLPLPDQEQAATDLHAERAGPDRCLDRSGE